ncbi:MAG: hypothetical protein ACXVRV_03570 [Gaiellaceae bacterium]
MTRTDERQGPRQPLGGRDVSARARAPADIEAALAYLDLLAEQKPEKLERACVRWHGRIETEATFLSLAESQLALAALASLCAGERHAIGVLRRLLRRVRPTVVSTHLDRAHLHCLGERCGGIWARLWRLFTRGGRYDSADFTQFG